MPPDPRPPKRIKDPVLLRAMHLQGGVCVLADDTCVWPLSLHHIHRHPRDDVFANLAWLCGSGTTGHHGAIEGHDREAKLRFGRYIVLYRLDTMDYLARKLGSIEAARAWSESQGYLPLA
jgi:hypothetical protein